MKNKGSNSYLILIDYSIKMEEKLHLQIKSIFFVQEPFKEMIRKMCFQRIQTLNLNLNMEIKS